MRVALKKKKKEKALASLGRSLSRPHAVVPADKERARLSGGFCFHQQKKGSRIANPPQKNEFNQEGWEGAVEYWEKDPFALPSPLPA